MKQLTVFTLVWATLIQGAFAICNMNRFGHNICTGEKALLVKDSSDSEALNQHYEVVTIKKVVRDRSTPVVIKAKNVGEIEVDIDKLVGNKLCEEDGSLCEGTKVTIKEGCLDPNYRSKYKVVGSYNKDIVELTTGGLFFSKSFLIDDNCIETID